MLDSQIEGERTYNAILQTSAQYGNYRTTQCVHVETHAKPRSRRMIMAFCLCYVEF
jgi:hypothetical protein